MTIYRRLYFKQRKWFFFGKIKKYEYSSKNFLKIKKNSNRKIKTIKLNKIKIPSYFCKSLLWKKNIFYYDFNILIFYFIHNLLIIWFVYLILIHTMWRVIHTYTLRYKIEFIFLFNKKSKGGLSVWLQFLAASTRLSTSSGSMCRRFPMKRDYQRSIPCAWLLRTLRCCARS